MPARSSLAQVRNPVLALPSAQRLQELTPRERERVAAVLMDIRSEARVKAEDSWRRSKGPMAAYWKAVATYAGHIARATRRAS